MSQLPPTLERDTSLYAPISLLAVASLVIAGLFSAVVLGLGGVAFYSSTPLLLPTWIVVMPLAGVALALLAQRQIRSSEGTLSGSALASWALGLSLLCGLGYYLAYLFPTYKAVTIQADTFTNEWFKKIRDGEVNSAFQDTLEFDQRGDNPRDEALMEIRFGSSAVGRKGPLTQFKEGEIVQLLTEAGPDATLTNLGVRTWDYEKGYRVVQMYRLTTLEGQFDMTVTAYRSDVGSRRTWRIASPETNVAQQTLTPRGRELRSWQVRARQFATAWLNERNRGNLPAVYLMTLPTEKRLQLEQGFQVKSTANLVGQLGAALVLGPSLSLVDFALANNALLNVEIFLAGYKDFAWANLLDLENLRVPAPLREEVLNDLRGFFQPDSPLRARLTEANHYHILPDQRLQVACEFELSKYTELSGLARYQCAGRLIVESNIGLDKTGVSPDWRVVKVELKLAGVPAPDEPGPGGPGGPGVPGGH